MTKNMLRGLIGIGFILLFIANCAHRSSIPETRDDQIEEISKLKDRFIKFENYRIQVRSTEIYKMVCPQYRKKISYETFAEKPFPFDIGILAFNIKSIEFLNDGKAKIYYSEYYTIPGTPVRNIRPHEISIWVNIDNEWFYFMDPDAREEMPVESICGSTGLKPHQPDSPSDDSVCGR